MLESLQVKSGVIRFEDVLLYRSQHNVLLKALLGKLVMPNFAAFATKINGMYHAVEATPRSVKNGMSRVQEEIRAATGSDDDFTVSVCTVDGQQYTYGTTSRAVPLMETVKPLLYALALKDCGRAAVHEVCVCVCVLLLLLRCCVSCYCSGSHLSLLHFLLTRLS